MFNYCIAYFYMSIYIEKRTRELFDSFSHSIDFIFIDGVISAINLICHSI